MAFTEGSQTGATSGTTAVVAVNAPSSDTRRIVKSITVYNADSASALVTLTHVVSSVSRTLFKGTLAVGDQLLYDEVIVLDTTAKTIEIVLGGAATTTELDFTAHYGDAT